MSNEGHIQPLLDLGFTEIEARVYGFLVEESPATGYRIAHAIGKQPANTYKAIAALETRGAIIVEQGDTKQCRAVPPEELLDNLEQRFRQSRSQAGERLATLSRRSADPRIYHLKSVDQVVQRAKAMLERARQIVLCDLFPAPFELLSDALRDAAGRGVRIAAKIYAGQTLPGVELVGLHDIEKSLSEWPGQQLSLVVDAEEHLLSLLSQDMQNVHEAVWSNSPYLSCMQHNHIASELRYTRLLAEHRDTPDKLAAISLLNSQPPGLDTLRHRYGEQTRGPAPTKEKRK
jgi:HTH-type transcriptional regulator, sugar sensing transcriptional regulator